MKWNFFFISFVHMKKKKIEINFTSFFVVRRKIFTQNVITYGLLASKNWDAAGPHSSLIRTLNIFSFLLPCMLTLGFSLLLKRVFGQINEDWCAFWWLIMLINFIDDLGPLKIRLSHPEPQPTFSHKNFYFLRWEYFLCHFKWSFWDWRAIIKL